MDAYMAVIRKLENKFSGLEIHHIIRDNNVKADVLSKLGSDQADVPPGIFVHKLHHLSVATTDQMIIDSGPLESSREVMMIDIDWRESFIDFFREQMLPPGVKKESAEAARLMRRSKSYILINGKLYKRGAGSGVLMKCVTTEDGKAILQELHEGSCGNHTALRNMNGKVFRYGFNWPTALVDPKALVRRCPGCQYFVKQTHLAAHNLITIPPSWPFNY